MGSGEGQMHRPEGKEGHKRGMVLYLNILEGIIFEYFRVGCFFLLGS